MRTAHLQQDLFDLMAVQSPSPPVTAQDPGLGLGQEWVGEEDRPRTGRLGSLFCYL